jgi:AcrR family transcriptional regulator
MPASRSARPRAPVAAARLEQRREEILERAISLFAEHGYADLDLQVLADDLSVGKGTLYRHFGSKQQLFLAAADRVMLNLRQFIDERIEGIADPLERITCGIHAYLAYFDAHPEAVEIFIQERAQFKDRKRPTYFEHREVNIKGWRTLYSDLIKDGRFRDLPVERLLEIIGNLLYGTMFVNYIAGRRRPSAQVAEDLIDILFHGVLSDRERHGRGRVSPSRDQPK